MADTVYQWIRCTKKRPCPVCGNLDYCSIRSDLKAVGCMRVRHKSTGTKMTSIGPCYMHDKEVALVHAPDLFDRSELEKPPKQDWTEEAKRCFLHPDAEHERQKLARRLGVTAAALEELRVGIGYTEKGAPYTTWPEWDSQRKQVVGLKKRYNFKRDGSIFKVYTKGSTPGLYLQRSYDPTRAVVVVEGGSDTAACIDAGIQVIGRPSVAGALDMVSQILKAIRPPLIFLLGENDENPAKRGAIHGCEPDCKGCRICWPGMFVAKDSRRELERQTARNILMLMPWGVCKDTLEWYRWGGGDRLKSDMNAMVSHGAVF